MKATATWIAALAICFTAVPAAAQRLPTPQDGCTYERCMLRLRGDRVIAGLEEREVVEGGFFSAPELRPMIEVSDSAAHYYGLAERDYGPAAFLSILGATVGAIGYVVLDVKGGEAAANWIGGGMLASGAALTIHGVRMHRNARENLELSLALYNDLLPNGPRGR